MLCCRCCVKLGRKTVRVRKKLPSEFGWDAPHLRFSVLLIRPIPRITIVPYWRVGEVWFQMSEKQYCTRGHPTSSEEVCLFVGGSGPKSFLRNRSGERFRGVGVKSYFTSREFSEAAEQRLVELFGQSRIRENDVSFVSYELLRKQTNCEFEFVFIITRNYRCGQSWNGVITNDSRWW